MGVGKLIKELIDNKTETYLIYGDLIALKLYQKSPRTLIESNCMEFGVVKYDLSKNVPEIITDQFTIAGFFFIKEEIYDLLHLNLCGKVGKLT